MVAGKVRLLPGALRSTNKGETMDDYCVVCDGPCQSPASHKPYEVNHG
jgi:hypothetical protein